MDIKQIITQVVEKLTSDETLKNQFLSDPIKTVEKLTGIDLPDEQIQPVIDGIKAKLNLEDAGGLLDKIKGFFGR
ncbi:MAG: hypothetical protein IKE30_02635 [Clostridia bacterium]|nr:hypothetical protein [Clostridia bacterium]